MPLAIVDGMEKSCIRCDTVKRIGEFYAHKAMLDGHLSVCKECVRRRVTARYERERDKISEYERERNKTPERKVYAAERQRKYRKANPEKDAARRKVGAAVKSGVLRKHPCERCGSEKSQAHHHDYSVPLDVEWLCFRCHREHAHGQVVTTDRTWSTMG